MHVRQLFAAALAAVLLASAASEAQTDEPAPPATKAPAKKKKGKGPAKRAKKKKTTVAPAPPAPPAPPAVDESAKKALEATPAPVPEPVPAPTAAPLPTIEAQTGPEDNDPPSISHTPVAKAVKGKSLALAARITDPSGVFQPVLYVRKKGMGTGEYIPIKMMGSRLAQGDYTVEIPPAIVSADLEYYIEAYDNVGNGPARAGAPESPFTIKVDEEQKKVIVAPTPTAPSPTVTIKPQQPKGAPPAISHTAVTSATKGQPVEINARLIGETGVQGATVLFRHTGEKEYRALPMGDLGEERYTATIPAQVVTGDLEYYLEAFDKFGNGPGRSGAANVPYKIQILEPMPSRPTRVTEGSTTGGMGKEPRLVKAPFRPNPGRAAGWLFMAGFVGSGVIAGGEALGAWKANDTYTHTYEYEGRLEPELLANANAYSHRAKLAGIVAGATLLTSIVLLVIFPEHPDTILVGGSGGDAATIRF